MKAIIKYNALFIASEHDVATIEKVKKYYPEALTLYKGEGEEREPVCAIATGDFASANEYGVVFANDSISEPKVAMMGVEIPSELTSQDEVRAWVRDKFGMMLVNCNKIDQQITAALVEIRNDESAMNSFIIFD